MEIFDTFLRLRILCHLSSPYSLPVVELAAFTPGKISSKLSAIFEGNTESESGKFNIRKQFDIFHVLHKM